MGNKKSKAASPVSAEDLVIQVISVHEVPKENLKESDPYVQLQVYDSKKKKVGDECHTLYFPKCVNAVFNTYLNTHVVPTAGMQLSVELWDYDHVSRNDKYGSHTIAVEELVKTATDQPKTLEFKMVSKGGKNATCVVKVVKGPMAARKKIFIIRHGESAWNEAQEGMDVVGMMEQVDHPLNKKGCEQAQGFNAKWRAKKDAGTLTDNEKIFVNADRVFASPLTRTTQTALLTLYQHTALEKRPITMLRNLREIKNLGGLDTVGKEIGEGIPTRVKTHLIDVLKEEVGNQVTNVKYDLNDAVQHWWSGTVDRDNNQEMEERFNDWLATVRHADYDVGIFVGHSLFFRKFCKDFCSAEYMKENEAMATKIGTKKLQNAGCLMLEIDFSERKPKIVFAESMFETGFVDDGEDEEDKRAHHHHSHHSKKEKEAEKEKEKEAEAKAE